MAVKIFALSNNKNIMYQRKNENNVKGCKIDICFKKKTNKKTIKTGDVSQIPTLTFLNEKND